MFSEEHIKESKLIENYLKKEMRKFKTTICDIPLNSEIVDELEINDAYSIINEINRNYLYSLTYKLQLAIEKLENKYTPEKIEEKFLDIDAVATLMSLIRTKNKLIKKEKI